MVLGRKITAQIKSVLKENPHGLSITDIVAAVNINRNTAGRYLENLLISGQVEMHRLGMAKIYTLSQRVPVSAVLSISSELFMQLDRDLRIVYANDPFLSFLSISSTEIFGKNIEYSRVIPVFETVSGELVNRLKDGLSGTEWAGEITLIERGIVFYCRIAPTVFEDGKKGVSVILEDITGHRHSEDALRESENRFHTILDNMQDAYFRADSDGRIIMASLSAARLFRYGSVDEMIGISAVSLYRDPEMRNEIIHTLIEQGVVQDFICEAMSKDGTSFWVSMNVQFVLDGKGRVAGTDGFIRNITERKRAEEALRASESLYRSLAEASQDLIFVIGRDDKVEYVNSFAAHLLGKQPEGIVGSPRSTLFPPSVSDRQKRQLTQVFLTGNPSRSESSMVINSETRWFDHFLVPVRDKEGNIQSVLGISRDITKQKQAEEALIKSEERFRDLINTTADMVWQTDADSRYVYVSPQVERILGYRPDELIGHTSFEFLEPESIESNRLVFETAIRTHQHILLYECRWIDRDGNAVVIESQATPVYNSDGTCAGFRGIDRDITDR